MRDPAVSTVAKGSAAPVRYRSSNVGVSLTDEFLDAVADLIGPESVRLSQ